MSTAVWMVMCRLPMTRAPASGFALPVLGAQRHQAGHFLLGQPDLLAAELGLRKVGDLERLTTRGSGRGKRVLKLLCSCAHCCSPIDMVRPN